MPANNAQIRGPRGLAFAPNGVRHFGRVMCHGTYALALQPLPHPISVIFDAPSITALTTDMACCLFGLPQDLYFVDGGNHKVKVRAGLLLPALAPSQQP